jgi:hypothetical protein
MDYPYCAIQENAIESRQHLKVKPPEEKSGLCDWTRFQQPAAGKR